MSLDVTLFTTGEKDPFHASWEFGLSPEKDNPFDSVGRRDRCSVYVGAWEEGKSTSLQSGHLMLWKPSAIMHLIPHFSQQHYGGGQWAVYQTLSFPFWAQIRITFPRSLCSLCCVTWNVNGSEIVCSSPTVWSQMSMPRAFQELSPAWVSGWHRLPSHPALHELTGLYVSKEHSAKVFSQATQAEVYLL